MELIRKLDGFITCGMQKQRLGLFLCPYCKKEVKKRISHGKIGKSCGCQVGLWVSTPKIRKVW